ncbi:unnamed protein product [Caretta caretta]
MFLLVVMSRQASLWMQDLSGAASRRGSFEEAPFFPFVLLICNVLEAPRIFFVVIVRETFRGVHGAAGDVSGAERGSSSKVAAADLQSSIDFFQKQQQENPSSEQVL